jgi:hypothetical protein
MPLCDLPHGRQDGPNRVTALSQFPAQCTDQLFIERRVGGFSGMRHAIFNTIFKYNSNLFSI